MRASTIALVVVAVAFAAERDARACGGGLVSISQGSVSANAQRIFISVRGNATTDIVTEIGVPDSSQPYGVLLPLPGQPTLDPMPVPSEELTTLAFSTAPRILESDPSEGCGCPLPGGAASKAGGSPPRVVIGAPVNIGPVTAVVLDASSADALNQWLANNGFAIPDASLPLIAAYSGPGRTFVAIRRSTTATSAAPSSVGVHMTLPGDVRDLPLRFARLGAAERVAFTVFVAAPVAVGPSAPFEAITINDIDAADLSGRGYEEAVFRAIAARGGRALVVEMSAPVATVSHALQPRLTALVDPTAVLTRISGVFAADALATDVSLNEMLTRTIPTTRTIAAVAGPAGTAVATLRLLIGLPLMLGLCGLALRRRPRG